MLAIKTILSVSPKWRKVLKQFRQTEVRCANGEIGDRQRLPIIAYSLLTHFPIQFTMGSRYFWLIARWRRYATTLFNLPEVALFTCQHSTALATKQHNRNNAHGMLCGFV